MMKTFTYSTTDSDFLYIQIANEIEKKITSGIYYIGEKLPSIRKLSSQLSVSISTIYKSFIELEKRGIVESKIKSGYYVTVRPGEILPQPKIKKHKLLPKKVKFRELSKYIHESLSYPSILPLGAAVVSPELLPKKQLSKIIRNISMNQMDEVVSYAHPVGQYELRKEISKLMLGFANEVDPDKIIITNGCFEAVKICLQSLAKPGDTIAIESPTFFQFLQLIEDLNMFALEIPSDPKKGLNLAYLERSLDEHEVKACICMPNFSNPTGSLMPLESKKKLVHLINRKEIPLIEDDLSGDLHFSENRPITLKSFDKKDLVLYCSSFSKTLSAGLRMGWVIPGRFFDSVLKNKLNVSIASPTLNQLIIAEYLHTGAYGRHLRSLRNTLKNQVQQTSISIRNHFPQGTRITSPQGGFLLWVQLPNRTNSRVLFQKAAEKNISILPGVVCSVTNKYQDFIRINCGYPWMEEIHQGIITLGNLIRELS